MPYGGVGFEAWPSSCEGERDGVRFSLLLYHRIVLGVVIALVVTRRELIIRVHNTQLPPSRKFKPNQQFKQPQSLKSRQSGGQSSSTSRPMGSQFMHPVIGQGLIFFK
ncbi:hypothetical protein BS78_09G093000 [Paspalum vaginatum]|nr:hypothetical protein BS78_09G093000 [Paspalum vaginatum]